MADGSDDGTAGNQFVEGRLPEGVRNARSGRNGLQQLERAVEDLEAVERALKAAKRRSQFRVV